ncbi:aminotransferase class IV [Nonomuraea pusilla]|uniref:Branched-chain amino acid aminotransferase/4-amino-4-deoxychorismate lyase n=1 Tax=Nonomuraea pusilla TaxID=46177 RepID=A0A1H7TM49_9ACTN|nr:aminotransferase class IV [Nonomuraea pusilla]SEL85748.1 Branched-chain amino acid aminotransferase/4-amino-4-deoxychorismate lyase [Nonomuraea pusilla]
MIERAVIDGRPVGADARFMLTARYGHFTAMQVRNRRVRGLDLHLARLDEANRELFGAPVDRDAVLGAVRAVLGGDARDGSVRVYVVETDRPHVLATLAPPAEAEQGPYRLRSVVFQRYLPHVKKAAGFAQAHLGRLVGREGYDEALLTSAHGIVSEGSITNLGCFDGERLVWPDAPMLRGITMRLLERVDVPQERRPLKVADLAGLGLVFVCNSRGVVPVGQVDDVALRPDPALAARVLGWYDAVPWDALD